MIQFLKSFLKKKQKSTKIYDLLTDDEIDILTENPDAFICPDCRGKLLEGPHGCSAANLLCVECGSEFNVCLDMPFFNPERISPPGPRDPGSRRNLYYREARRR